MAQPTPISQYQKEAFAHPLADGTPVTHDIYTLGQGSRIIVLIQELPGIGRETLRLADMLVAEGFRVVLPHLFGRLGRKTVVSNTVHVCISKEFKLFARNQSSPITTYLAGLCQMLKEKYQTKGVGVIGMCLTGNFAISLMANDAVLAGFASQPSLPFFSQSAAHMSPDEIQTIKKRLDVLGPMHCGRFEKDFICTRKRIDSLDRIFNTDEHDRIIFHEIPGFGHSILTLHFNTKEKDHPTQKAFREVVGYFQTQLS